MTELENILLEKREISEEKRRASLANLRFTEGLRGTQERIRADGVNASLPNALHGDLDPVRLARRETPAHRTMVNMAAAGYTNCEIAKLTGYNAKTVATALKQPHAREYLINEAKKTVQDEIKELLAKEALPSLRVLASVRDDELAPAPARISASNSLLDRFLGKPVQPISDDIKPPSQMTDEELRAQVERELSQPKPSAS